jgi:hypothetical protein
MKGKTMKKLLSFAVLLLGLSALGFGQTALTSTTLSSAISDSKTQVVVVASATGINAPSTTDPSKATVLYVDREVMFVNGVSGTTLYVTRGYGSTRANSHASSATVYIAPYSGAGIFIAYANYGSCTASSQQYLPMLVTAISSPDFGSVQDCFGGQWQFDLNLPIYKFTVAPNAQRSAAAATVGNAISLTSQAGSAQSATTGNGGAGGANSSIGGAGGVGGTSSGTGGAGGAVNMVAGAGGGTVTGGAGGLATVGGGAGANGSSAGGSGGGLNIYSGAKGTGGTGTDGAVNIRQGGAAGTAALSVSTAGATTLASTVAGQNIAITPATTGLTQITNGGALISLPTSAGSLPSLFNCGASLAAGGACANTQATAASAHIIFGSALLSGSTSTITGISPAYTSTSTFFCVANDVTTRANPVQMVPASASTVTITNTTGATDLIQFICVGY